MKPTASLFAFGLAFVLVAGAAEPVIHDLSNDFSLAGNPNGVWSYGWKSNLTGNLTLFANARAASFPNGVPVQVWELNTGFNPVVMRNSGSSTGLGDAGTEFPPGTVWCQAGFDGRPENFGVIRFTVPSQGAGTYILASSARCYLDGTASRDADYHVVVNGVEVFGQFLAANSGTGYTNTFSLAVGDTIDLMTGRGADGQLYGSGLKIEAKLTHPSVCTPHKATATPQVINGFIVGATITDVGCGYTTPPPVLIEGGGGAGATATATVSNGWVVAVNITSAGCCYTNGTPQIVIGSPPFIPTVAIKVSKITVTQNVMLGRRYQLESSHDLSAWNPVGSPFTAQSETIQNDFDANVTGRFFRIREVP